MSRNYALNPELAKQAGMSNWIDSTGKYIGKFTRAEVITSKQKTEGVEFTFQANDGRTADYLSCWTFNIDGKELYGLKMLNAIMTCMKARQLNPSMAFIDSDKGKHQAEVFLDLMNKPIGILLQKEEYEKNDGSIGYKFNIVGCFEASSELTAKEILEQCTKPEQLGRMIATLKDKPLSTRRQASAIRTENILSSGHPFSDFSDDIPF